MAHKAAARVETAILVYTTSTSRRETSPEHSGRRVAEADALPCSATKRYGVRPLVCRRPDADDDLVAKPEGYLVGVAGAADATQRRPPAVRCNEGSDVAAT
jgi:hypothetical protein